jgi:hypothetical protein
MEAVDISSVVEKADLLTSLYIPSAADALAISSITVKLGSDDSNYYQIQVTTAYGNLAFRAGWNYLVFDWDTLTQVGTPDDEAITYLQLAITRSTSTTGVSGWSLDRFVLNTPTLYNVVYYSEYFWKSAAGVYLTDSTADTDLLLADTEEFDIHITKILIDLAQSLREVQTDLPEFKEQYKDQLADYTRRYKSERLQLQTTYNDFRQL